MRDACLAFDVITIAGQAETPIPDQISVLIFNDASLPAAGAQMFRHRSAIASKEHP